MAGSFSYTDNVRAALASCLPCFITSHSNSTSNPSLTSDQRPAGIGPSNSSSADLQHLLHDPDPDALSLHSNLGSIARRRPKHRRRPKFSLTLFGYTLFGRPPIYLSDDEENESGVGGRRARGLITASSSTLDSDAAPLDASTIERLTSPDHFAALAAQREQERQRLETEEAARRKAERRARRQERKARTRAAEVLMSRSGASPRPELDAFEGFQGSGDGIGPAALLSHQSIDVAPGHPDLDRFSGDGDFSVSHSGDADDADLGGEFYTQKKKSPAALSMSGSDSRSRTSASFSAGDASHTQNFLIHTTHQSIPYPHTEMHLPAPVRKKSHRSSKPMSTVSSVTSESTSTAPYTPVESIAESPAVAAFPVSQERYIREGERADFPSVGLSGKRGHNTQDLKTFLAHQG